MISAGCEGGFNWYGFLIGFAMVVCIVIAYIMGTRRGYYKDLVFDIVIICIPLAIMGARLYYVLFSYLGEGKTWTFAEILGIGSGGLSGLAIYGGLIGAVIGGVIVHFWKRKKPAKEKATFLQMCDLAFTVIILGQAIGRWGNFANQEAYGNLVTNTSLQWFPYAVFIDSKNAWFQATFFYESFLNVIGFALLMWIYNGKRKSFDGFSLSIYLIYYGLVRFFIEGLRSDSLYLVGNLRVSQLLSAILVFVGIGIIVAHFYLARSKNLKPFVFVPKDKLSNEYYGYESSILSHPNVYEKKKDGFFKRMFSTASTPEIPDSDEDDSDEADEPDFDKIADELLPELSDKITGEEYFTGDGNMPQDGSDETADGQSAENNTEEDNDRLKEDGNE